MNDTEESLKRQTKKTLEVGELEADAAEEEVGEGEGGGEGEELDGVLEGEGAKDEVGVVEVDVAEQEGAAATDRIEVGLGDAVGGEGDVVSVEDDEGSAGEQGCHGGGLLGVDADGDEALPLGAGGKGSGGSALKAGEGDMEGLDDRGGSEAGLGEGGGGGDDGDELDGVGGVAGGEIEGGGQELIDGEALGFEDAIEAVERKGAAAIEEVGDVGLTEAGELGEAGSGEMAGLNAAGEFLPKQLMECGEVHGGELTEGRSANILPR